MNEKLDGYLEFILCVSAHEDIFAYFLSENIKDVAIEFVKSNDIFDIFRPDTWRALEFNSIESRAMQVTESNTDVEKIFSNHQVDEYFKKHGIASSTKLIVNIESSIDVDNLLVRLRAFCATLAGLEPFYIFYACTQKQNKDWIDAYKNSIQPIQVANFLITPSWHKPLCLDSNIKPIFIDPALAFGSGHHASTYMCIEFLSTMNLEDKNLLDVGCGSGILSIIGAKLGARVSSCDVDLVCVESTIDNAIKNDVKLYRVWEGSIGAQKEVVQGNMLQIPEPQKVAKQKGQSKLDAGDLIFDVIFANISPHILNTLLLDFKRHLAKDGDIVISGISVQNENIILDVFLKHFSVLERKEKDDWVALHLAPLNKILRIDNG